MRDADWDMDVRILDFGFWIPHPSGCFVSLGRMDSDEVHELGQGRPVQEVSLF